MSQRRDPDDEARWRSRLLRRLASMPLPCRATTPRVPENGRVIGLRIEGVDVADATSMMMAGWLDMRPLGDSFPLSNVFDVTLSDLGRRAIAEAGLPTTDGPPGMDASGTMARPFPAEVERDAERWRKLSALMRAASEGADIDVDGLFLVAETLHQGAASRWNRVGLNFRDSPGEPLNLAAAIDAAPWPDPRPDEEPTGAPRP